MVQSILLAVGNVIEAATPVLVAAAPIVQAALAARRAMASVEGPSIPDHCPPGASAQAKKILGMDTQKINIGVTGQTRAGKSKLINTLRGLKSTDPGAATTGVVECSSKPQPYPFGLFSKAVLWDMPGAGTRLNPTATYFKDKHLIAYDIVFIVYCDTIKEIDVALAKAMLANNVPFFLVRSKTDQAMEEGVEDGLKEEDIIADIKAHAIKELTRNGIQNIAPYCVSGRLTQCQKYDMLQLISAVGTSIAAHRRKL